MSATGMPTTTLDSKVAFNDVQFGFVPHGGSSYYLSRLPGELGTFLAITGLPLTGIDARELGVVDELIHKTKTYEKKILDILVNLEFPMPTGYHLSDRFTKDPWKSHIGKRIVSDDKDRLREINEAARRSHKNTYFSEFAEPRDRHP